MTKVLTINHIVPISDSNRGEDGSGLYFNQWIPDDPHDAIVITDGSHEISISIDKSCVKKPITRDWEEVTDDVLNAWMNIHVSKLIIDVTLKNIDDDLACFIYNEREGARAVHHGINPCDIEDEAFTSRFESLGKQVAKLTLDALNRVISFARNEKGQYWLTLHCIKEIKVNSINNQLRAKAKIDSGEWFSWCPPHRDIHSLTMRGVDETAIKREDWEFFCDFVTGSKRPKLVFELKKGNKGSSLLKHLAIFRTSM